MHSQRCVFCDAGTVYRFQNRCCQCNCCMDCAPSVSVISSSQRRCLHCGQPGDSFSELLDQNGNTIPLADAVEELEQVATAASPAPRAGEGLALCSCGAAVLDNELFFCDLCGSFLCPACARIHVTKQHQAADPYYRLLSVPDATRFLAANMNTLLDEAAGLRVRAAATRLWVLRPGGALAQSASELPETAHRIAKAADALASALQVGNGAAAADAENELQDAGVDVSDIIPHR